MNAISLVDFVKIVRGYMVESGNLPEIRIRPNLPIAARTSHFLGINR